MHSVVQVLPLLMILHDYFYSTVIAYAPPLPEPTHEVTMADDGTGEIPAGIR